MRVAVLGAGGIGGYFGGRLAEAGTADVYLIARGAHLNAIKRDGLKVTSYLGDMDLHLPASDDPADIGPVDYVLFTVKSYDTEEAGKTCEPLIGGNTAIVTLQNGVDNEDKLSALWGEEHVMGGVARIFATIQAPGHIVHTESPSSLSFGELDHSISERGRALEEAFRSAGVKATLSDDIQRELWVKWAFICAQAGVTAATQLPIGEIRSVSESRQLFIDIAQAVNDVGQADGIDLPDDLAERCIEFADGLDPAGRSSLYHDLAHGNRMELEALIGHLGRKAAQHGIPAPAVDVVYSILKPWAARNEK